MSGAAGHLKHPYEDLSLTFQELKEILVSASDGKLEQCVEKFDGLNIVFSYNQNLNELRVARGKTDIKTGGLTLPQLRAKFEKLPTVQSAMSDSFKIIEGALSILPKEQKQSIFGELERWYSAEIIYPENANVINYDSNSVVFHGTPVFDRSSLGDVKQSINTKGVDELVSCINKMQNAVSATNWKITGPIFVEMQKISDKSVISGAIQKIDTAIEGVCSDSSTIGEFLEAMLYKEVGSVGLTTNVAKALVKRCVYGMPSLVVIKKNTNKYYHEKMSEFVGESPKKLKHIIEPIEFAIHDVAVAVLKTMRSSMVSNNEMAVLNLKQQLELTLDTLETSKDPNIAHQIKKLGDIEENVVSSIEGVVFVYKGTAYKFTGVFAPMNQLMGIFRYDR